MLQGPKFRVEGICSINWRNAEPKKGILLLLMLFGLSNIPNLLHCVHGSSMIHETCQTIGEFSLLDVLKLV